jgi:Uma2 family endonuclease
MLGALEAWIARVREACHRYLAMAQPKPAPPLGVQPVALGRAPTYADVEALPGHLRGEIVGGQLYALPRPRPLHIVVAQRLAGWLDQRFDGEGPGGWWVLPEPELHFEAARPIIPDLGGWRRERMPALPTTAAIALAPDWVCEVLSPSTESYDRGPKMDVYGRQGIPWAWLVDPEARTLEAYRNDEATWRQVGAWRGPAIIQAPPFEDVALDFGRLWRAM